jgi:hypothetical protein
MHPFILHHALLPPSFPQRLGHMMQYEVGTITAILLVVASALVLYTLRKSKPGAAGERPPGPREAISTNKLPHSVAAREYIKMGKTYGQSCLTAGSTTF